MSGYLGDYTTANTVYVYFNTFDSNDPSASVTLTGLALADILIYKNGSVTQRSSTAGITLLDTDGIDFDGNTGIHGFSISLADNTDAGFYAAGSEYTVVVASVTVDAATVNFVAAQFSIERTGGALALLKGTNSLSDIESKIDTLTTNLATVDGIVDDILVDTAVIGAAGAGLTAIPWNASWDAEVQSECADALTAYDPPTKAELDSAVAALATQASVDVIDGIVDSILVDTAEIGAAGAGLTALASAANLATVDTVVDSILVDTAEIGAAGAGLTAIPWNASWDAEVQSECADALTAYDPPTKAEMDSGFAALNDLDAGETATAVWNAATATYGAAGSYGLLVETNLDAAVSSASAPSAAAVADAVWDEALSGHLSAGTTGEALNAAGAAGDPWTTTLPGAYTGSQAGKMLSDIITDTAEIGSAGAGLTALATAAALATVDTVVDSILVDTAEIGAAGAGLTAIPWNSSWDTEVQSECTDALNAYDPPTKAELDSAVSPLATASALSTVSGYLDTEVAAILADTNELQTDWANGGRLDVILDARSSQTSVDTIDGIVDSILVDTAEIGAAGAGLTALASAANLATVDTVVDAILVGTDTTIPGLIAALNDLAASDILTTALTESYAADGAAPTLTQAIYLIQQFLYERATSGTTVTVKKLDGSTTAATLTLNDGTTPTSITRAS